MKDGEFTTTTILNNQTTVVHESMTMREKAEGIVKSATVASFDHNGFPYAVVEVPVLVDTIEAWINHVAERGSEIMTTPTGYPTIDDILESIAPHTQPAPETGKWRVEHFTKDGADEWMVVTGIGRTVALSNVNDSKLAEAEMRQVVADHNAVPRLVEALKEAMKVVSDRAAGGRMLTTADEASEIWKRCEAALTLTTLRRSG